MSIDNQSFCVIWPNPRLQNCIISRYRNLFSFLHCKPLENLIDFPCKMHSSHNKFQRMLRCCHAVSRPVRWAFSSHPLTTSFEKAVRMQPMREGTILKKVPHGALGFSAFRWTNAIGALIEIIPHNFKIVKSDTHYLVDIPKKIHLVRHFAQEKGRIAEDFLHSRFENAHFTKTGHPPERSPVSAANRRCICTCILRFFAIFGHKDFCPCAGCTWGSSGALCGQSFPDSYTSLMIAISAASPRRGPIFTIWV